jgi:DNA polymerase-3 subunit epsilon
MMNNMRLKAPLIDPAMSFNDVRLVVVDTELTGLDEKRDCIVSIGAVRMTNGTIDIGDAFYQLVKPRTELSASSVVIHEITPSDVAAKPPIETVLADFLDFAGDDILLGHFVSIDLVFLNQEMKRVFGHKIQNPVLDTYSIYEWLSNQLKSRTCFTAPNGHQLYDIAKCFGIPVNGIHNAIADAFTTAQIMQRFFPLLTETGARTIGALLKIGIPYKGGERVRLSGEFGNF